MLKKEDCLPIHIREGRTISERSLQAKSIIEEFLPEKDMHIASVHIPGMSDKKIYNTLWVTARRMDCGVSVFSRNKTCYLVKEDSNA